MKKMNVIAFFQTGHVLGVVTRTSQPEAAVTTEQVAAGGYRLRSFDDSSGRDIILEIPEDEISVALVDYDTRVLYRPHLFILDNGKPEQKPIGMPLGGPGPPIPPNLTLVPVGILGGNLVEITVTLPDPVTSVVKVWCQISGGSLTEPIIRAVEIEGDVAAPTAIGTESLDLPAGDYRVALFAPGYALAVFLESVP